MNNCKIERKQDEELTKINILNSNKILDKRNI